MFSAKHIKNEVRNFTSSPPSSEDYFGKKLQAKISPSDKSFEKKRRRIDKVQVKTTNGTKQVLIRTN